jgi:uncharacterized protein GlcG (DUF336 family)
MDGAMLASIQIAEHKARAAVTFRRPTKVFEDGVQLMHLNYRRAFDGIIASRGGIPLIEHGAIIGAIGCSRSNIRNADIQEAADLIRVGGTLSVTDGLSGVGPPPTLTISQVFAI